MKPRVSAEAARGATGRDWDEWFALLDEWGATGREHAEIARWLIDEHGVPGWWAQNVSVEYERARGMRAPGEKADGFEAGASKTVSVPVERLYDAVTDDAERRRWLPGAELGLRTKTAPKTARYDWEDGSTRVVAYFEPKGDGRSTITIAHQKLPDAAAAEEMKAYWRERLRALKERLEGGAD